MRHSRGLITVIVKLRDEHRVGLAGPGGDNGLDTVSLFAEVEAHGAVKGDGNGDSCKTLQVELYAVDKVLFSEQRIPARRRCRAIAHPAVEGDVERS